MRFEITITKAETVLGMVGGHTCVSFNYRVGLGIGYGSGHASVKVYDKHQYMPPPFVTEELLMPELKRWAREKMVEMAPIDPLLIGKVITIMVTQ